MAQYFVYLTPSPYRLPDMLNPTYDHLKSISHKVISDDVAFMESLQEDIAKINAKILTGRKLQVGSLKSDNQDIHITVSDLWAASFHLHLYQIKEVS